VLSSEVALPFSSNSGHNPGLKFNYYTLIYGRVDICKKEADRDIKIKSNKLHKYSAQRWYILPYFYQHMKITRSSAI
jgi:hypothetical protein